MIIDCHVHIAADSPGHGSLSDTIKRSLPMRFLRWRLKVTEAAGDLDRLAEAELAKWLDSAAELDAAVVLAFDGVYDSHGQPDSANTHFYVANDYVAELCRRHPKMLFGASVHPYRKDAVAELERCVAMGAVLLKWLPITQNFNPADPRCYPLYEAMAHYKLPLLSHTGWERMLPRLNLEVADPALLQEALKRGVAVIAAHCGTRASPGEDDFVAAFLRLARQYENFYGDTAALNLPTRSYVYTAILGDPAVRTKLVHGSDWPIPPVPPATRLGLRQALRLLHEPNWLRRDVLIKRALGFDKAYWHRGATLLRLPNVARPGT